MARRLLSAVLLLSGCTAGWNNVVHYSDQPALLDQTLLEGVYAAVLRSYVDPTRDSVVVVAADQSPTAPDGPSYPATAASIPDHWADTLRREVEAALADTGRGAAPTPHLIEGVASRLGIRLLTTPPAMRVPGERPVPQLAVSAPGFNSDSTIAVVEVAFHCGPLCGSGQVLYLARRPGRAWRIWHADLTWVS